MKNARSLLAALAILAVAALAYPTAAVGADQDGRVVFTNGLSYLERSAAVPSGSQHSLRYGCGHHRRTFVVYAASDTSRETQLATGGFELHRYEDVNTTGYPCVELVLGEGQGIVSYAGSEDVRVEYEVTSTRRARFTLYRKVVQDPGTPL